MSRVSVGDTVLVFTASGSYRGSRGVVTKVTPDDVWVHLDGERLPECFADARIIPAEDVFRPHAGAE